ncbi:hypothetical protein AMQ83_23590 [Paenibacillus riograndensis]|nr:hypothetical protein AMQ83_23590 [Paenibacillus riograndensis]
MLNVALCDDDSRFLDGILPLIKKTFTALKINASIHLFTSANALIQRFEEYNPYFDIIFLDIDMPLMNGKEVARRLRLIDQKFKLVFITSFEQEALNTFQFNVSGFLPKLLLDKRMPAVIERVANAIHEENPQTQIFKINVNDSRNRIIKVPLNDIMYLESMNRKIYLHTKRKAYLLHCYKFMDLIEHYKNLGFVEIYRTCIVNLKYIFSIDDLEIRLDNGTTLPLSRRKRQNVLDNFCEIISEIKRC